MKPVVSVVIPAWNAAATLAEAVASVRAQDVGPVEILVVDDGSTDGTPGVNLDRDTVRIRTETNRGPAAARNTGLAAARAELIGFLDADDLWPPGSLRLLYDALADPAADAAGGLVQLTTGDAPVGAPWRATHLGRTIWRRAFVDRVGPLDESLRRAEDLDWIARARDAGLRAVELDALTYVYRVHGGNAMADIAARNRAMLDVLRRRLHRRRGP